MTDTRFDVYTTERLTDAQRAFLLVHFVRPKRSGPLYDRTTTIAFKHNLTGTDRGAVLIVRKVSEPVAERVRGALREHGIKTRLVPSSAFRPPLIGFAFETDCRALWRKLWFAYVLLLCLLWMLPSLLLAGNYFVAFLPLVSVIGFAIYQSFVRRPFWPTQTIDEVLERLGETRRGAHFAATDSRLAILAPGGRWFVTFVHHLNLLNLASFTFLVWISESWFHLFATMALIPAIPLIGQMMNCRYLDRRQLLFFAHGSIVYSDSISNYPRGWDQLAVRDARFDGSTIVITCDHHRPYRIPLSIPETECAGLEVEVHTYLNTPFEPTGTVDPLATVGRKFWRYVKRRFDFLDSRQSGADSEQDDDPERQRDP